MTLSWITFIPAIGALAVILAPKSLTRTVALIAALGSFALSLTVLFSFSQSATGYQFVSAAPWLPQFGIQFKLGVDGISLWMLMLTTFIFPIVIGVSSMSIHQNEKTYYVLMLVMETATLGVFLSLDLFLFYVFWEFALVPMYFIIGLFGGERRSYASVKFFVYTMAGSVLMLIAILWLGIGGKTFDMELLQQQKWFAGDLFLFSAFALAFAIKVPMFPFHSWLPDAHVEAPTPGSIILAAVLLKMGAYGLIRFNLGLFPQASRVMAPLMIGLSVIGILYGAVVAFAQSDMKKLIAYSSVSHMGYIVLGIFAFNTLGIQGAILQMVNHGLSTGGLFMIVGFIYERLHTREMKNMGGLWTRMPVYGTLALLFVLSSVGLPALNGFVGEYVILQGAYQANPWAATFAAVGMVLSAVYLLTMFQKVFLGVPAGEQHPARHGRAAVVESNGDATAVASDGHGAALADLSTGEIFGTLPLLALCALIGLYSWPFFNLMSSSVGNLLAAAIR